MLVKLTPILQFVHEYFFDGEKIYGKAALKMLMKLNQQVFVVLPKVNPLSLNP
jgi:hypothetical protein